MEKGNGKKRVTRVIPIVITAVVAVAAFFLLAVREKKTGDDTALSLAQFTYDGEYGYENLEWGMSEAEVVKRLPFAVEKDEEMSSDGWTVYKSVNAVMLNGQGARATFEFEDGGLTMAQLNFYLGSDYQQWYDTLSEEMLQKYGEESRRLENTNGQFSSWGYSWDSEGTMLQIVLLTGESIDPSGSVAVGRKQ